jgi:cytochrome c oxidase assembly factor 4
MIPPKPRSPQQNTPDDEEDPYITRIKKSGCFKEHEALQDCYYEKKDWRSCREEMIAFRACFAKHQDTSSQASQDQENSNSKH